MRSQREARIGRPRTRDEERDRAVLQGVLDREAGAALGRREHRQMVDMLAAYFERFAAGRQKRHARARRQQSAHELRARIDDVLAIVEQDEHLLGAQMGGQHFDAGTLRRFDQLENRGCLGGHQTRIGQRRETDEPHPVGKIREQSGAGFERAASLPDASDADERDEPLVRQQLRNLRNVGVAADQFHVRGQIVLDQARVEQIRRFDSHRLAMVAADGAADRLGKKLRIVLHGNEIPVR